MTLLSENFVRDDTNEDRIVLTGLNISLQSSLVTPEKDLVVRAEIINISEKLELPERKIHLFAKQIYCKDGAVIDVSGKSGHPDFTGKGRANDGRSSGASGSQGEKGGGGGNAGEIKLITNQLFGQIELLAQGGNGGKAQDGGNGAQGKHGGNGQHGLHGYNNLANAGNGRQGGSAGAAGIPGNGGDGGKIVVDVRNDFDANQISVDVSAGAAGARGSTGHPGPGGPPGKPGTYTICYDGPGRHEQ